MYLSGVPSILELAFFSRTSRDTKNPRARYEVQLLILPTRAPFQLKIPTYVFTVIFQSFEEGLGPQKRGF